MNNSAMWSAIIGGVVAAGSAIAQGISNKKNNERLIASQKEQNETNRSWSLEDWDRLNEYNSPVNQQKLFAEAGYVYQPDANSALASSVNTPTATALTGNGQFSQLGDYANALNQGVQTGLSVYDTMCRIDQTRSTTDEIKQRNKKMFGDGGLYDATIDQIVSQTTGQNLANFVADATKNQSIEQAKITTDSLLQTFRNMSAAYGGIKAQSENYQNMVNEFGNDYWRAVKNTVVSDSFTAQSVASFKQTENAIYQQYGKKSAELYNQLVTAQIEKYVEEVRNARFYNEPEMRNLMMDMLNGQINVLNTTARGNALQNVSFDKVHNKLWFTDDKGKKWDYDQWTALQSVQSNSNNMVTQVLTNQIMQHEEAGAAYKNGIIRLAADDFTNWTSRIVGVGVMGKFLGNGMRMGVTGNFGRQKNPLNTNDFTGEFKKGNFHYDMNGAF